MLQVAWAGAGATTIIYLAAIASIQSDLYEAAELDGAGIFSRIWHVTLPQMRGVILLMLLLQIIGTFQIFAEPFIMTGGGPENKTTTLLILIYRYAFIQGDYGKADDVEPSGGPDARCRLDRLSVRDQEVEHSPMTGVLVQRPQKQRRDPEAGRSVISSTERRRPRTRIVLTVVVVVVLAGLIIASAGPLAWLAKAATSTTADTVQHPLELWPSGFTWDNFFPAWTQLGIDLALWNSFVQALGSTLLTLLVALTGAYVISILRPKYAPILSAAVLATLFIPGVISLVPLYITVLDVPIVHLNLLNTYWAVWLPAAASAFNVLIVSRFFDALPRELFEAARVDGANSWRVFWQIVLPLSRPIIGVVAVLSFIAAWKDFLWPLLVLPSSTLQPLSVVLQKASGGVEVSMLMAGMFLSVVVPVALFLLFQKQFLNSAGQAGALKG